MRPATLWRSARNVGRRLRRCERGVTLTELIVSMAVMGMIIAALVTMFTSGANAEARMNLRFQSQTQARVALDMMRRDIHNACSATVSGGGAQVTLKTRNTATVTGLCTVTSGSWCTSGTGTRYGLYRSLASASCSSSNEQRADYLTAGDIFSIATVTGQLPQVGVDMTINIDPTLVTHKYVIEDEIALRNARRTS